VITDNEVSKTLKAANLFQISYIIAIFIYVILLYIVKNYIELWIFPSGDPTLNLIEIILIIVSAIVLALGYFLPRLAVNWYKRNLQALYSFHFTRSTLFLTIGILGLILGILGSGWQVSLPLLMVAILALIFTFPTEGKRRKMIEASNIEDAI